MRDDGGLSVTRVLVVEDHELFRRYIRSALEARQDFRLVGEAVDGLEGVHKCLELQPDVVLMDIGLPGLSGIEAVRRIRAIVPGCNVVFLTQESSSEVVHKALELGATGYIIKVQAAGDLIPALVAARDGRRFVSSGIAGLEPCVLKKVETSASRKKLETPRPQRSKTTYNHEIHFYPDDASYVAGFAFLIECSLKARKAVLALLGERHREEIFQALATSGIDVNAAIAARRLVTLDVALVRADFMVNGRVDRLRLWRSSIGTLEKLMQSNPGAPVSVCGEGASALLGLGNGEAALQVERVWDEIAVRYSIDVFCPYLLSSSAQARRAYEQIREAHSVVTLH